ncbi:hypothetical protein [Nocardia niwae]|uniref:Uncharacterized protein n=1 Tax=Nocardia niwae TaxID=626084 RepID=A0ABV2XCB5_9NOCA
MAAALRAHRLGLPPPGDDRSFTEPDQPTPAAELAWLVEVAIQFDTSPLVPATPAALESPGHHAAGRRLSTCDSAFARAGSAPPSTR